MKRYTIAALLALILLLSLGSAISANAAEVNYSATSEESAGNETETTEDPIDDSLPEKYNSNELGYCTSVKNQLGKICWAYASAATYESYLLKNNIFNSEISPDALDLWGTTQGNGLGWQRNTYEAGYTYICLGNFTSWNGPDTVLGEKVPYGVTAARYLKRENRDEIKRAIMNSGGVCANFNSDSLGYNQDRTAFFMPETSRSIVGHTVEIIGWDDNYAKENFNGSFKPSSGGAWLCKNSWGETFNSLGGFMWISYNDYYLFNDECFPPSFSIEKTMNITENDSIYQNEIYGATYDFRYGEGDNKVYFNVFDFNESGNVLNKVVFNTASVGAEYTVYYTPVDGNGVPDTDKSRWSQLGSGVVEYIGYTCCEFDEKTVSRAKGAIAVEIDTSALNEGIEDEAQKKENTIGVSEWLRNQTSREMIFISQCVPGQCFFMENGEIKDIHNIYTDEFFDEIGGTFVIKAITCGTVETNLRGDVNLDGVVDISDATLIQKNIAGITNELGDDQLKNADFNQDETIDIMDVTAIQKSLIS